MATITSLGAGSGLDLESLVTNLMTAERVPLTLLQKQQTSYETKISAMSKLNSVLDALKTAATGMATSGTQSAVEKFSTYTATVTNTSIASATATAGAVNGSFSLEVTQLASAQQLKSSGYTASDTTKTLTLEMGSVTETDGIKTFSATTTVDISIGANSTLKQVRDAINTAATGVTASIITDKDGVQQLVMSSKEGLENVMRISGDVAGLAYDPTDGSGSFTEITPAKDAEFKLNGIEARSSSNTVTMDGVGVTLEFSATNTGTPTTLKITSEAISGITSALEAFITAYNSANTTMKSLGAYNASTQTAGDLQGNSALRTAMSQIRSVIFSANSGNASAAYQTLSNIGVSVDTDGSLSLDKTKLNTAITNDASTVASLVSNVGKAYGTTITNLIGTNGSVTNASESLTKSVDRLKERQEQLEFRLEAIEARYRAQFSALDTLIGNLTTTGNYITSYISSLSSSKS